MFSATKQFRLLVREDNVRFMEFRGIVRDTVYMFTTDTRRETDERRRRVAELWETMRTWALPTLPLTHT